MSSVLQVGVLPPSVGHRPPQLLGRSQTTTTASASETIHNTSVCVPQNSSVGIVSESVCFHPCDGLPSYQNPLFSFRAEDLAQEIRDLQGKLADYNMVRL